MKKVKKVTVEDVMSMLKGIGKLSGKDADKVREMNLATDLRFDSLDVVELMMEIERDCHLSISEEKFDKVLENWNLTIGEFINIINAD